MTTRGPGVATDKARGMPAYALHDLRRFEGPNRFLTQRCVAATLTFDGGDHTIAPESARRLHALLERDVRISRLVPDLAELDAVLLGGAAVPVAEAVAATGVALQYLCGEAVTRWRVVPGERPGSATLACACEAADIGAMALHTASRLVASLARDQQTEDAPLAAAPVLAPFLKFMRRRMLDFTSRCLVAEAIRRGIPWRRVEDGLSLNLLIELGEGHRQVRMVGAVSDRTSGLGTRIAGSKMLSSQLLARIGLPAAEHVAVQSADAAVEAARAMGDPVVIKPENGSNGRGVAIGVAGEDAVRAAFEAARVVHSRVLVERFIPGDDHRMLVVNGRLIATARREAAHVIGDGVQNIRRLVDEVNADPRRARGVLAPLKTITLDPPAMAMLQEAGLNPDRKSVV